VFNLKGGGLIAFFPFLFDLYNIAHNQRKVPGLLQLSNNKKGSNVAPLE